MEQTSIQECGVLCPGGASNEDMQIWWLLGSMLAGRGVDSCTLQMSGDAYDEKTVAIAAWASLGLSQPAQPSYKALLRALQGP